MSTTPQYNIPPPIYPFLSNPPQKNFPSIPLPSPPPLTRRRSNTTSTIAFWAAHVQPGSPASISPRSPRRRPSISYSRRPSVSHSRGPSGSFLNILDTPSTAHRTTTPSVKDYSPDLVALGYTTVFVHLPKGPRSPCSPSRKPAGKPTSNTNIPMPPVPASPQHPKSRPLKRFRSLSVLKPIRMRQRSKSTTTTTTTTTPHALPKPQPKVKPARPPKTAEAIAMRNKAKYAYLRPAPLANELALMQFADGGSMEFHVKRVMESQARAAAGTGAHNAVAVGDVFRDGQGGIWWDQDEEWEYAHLLGGEQLVGSTGEDDPEWVRFGEVADKENTRPALAALEFAGDERRESVSTQDSDLDARFVVHPSSEDDLAAFGGALAPIALYKPAISVLSPTRTRRTAKHVRPLLPKGISASTSTSSRFPGLVGTGNGHHLAFVAPKGGKARRRPAPLNLAPLSPGLKRPSNSPVDAEKIRREFINGSFAPAPLPSVLAGAGAAAAAPGGGGGPRIRKMNFAALRQAMTSLECLVMPDEQARAGSGGMKKPSRMNMRALFRIGARKEED